MNNQTEIVMEQKCIAEYYGKCGGRISEHEVVWHVRPRSKDLQKGHGPSETTLNVCLCAEHYVRISKQYNSLNRLPELYGWDEADALDGLTCYLHYTGFNPTYCAHCSGLEKTTVSETGACTKACKAIFKMGVEWIQCHCRDPVECVCASFANNELHWAILTYIHGFDFDFNRYDCAGCDRPSWRDTHEYYKNGLVDTSVILDLAAKNPALILEKNAFEKTPLTIIDPIIESLVEMSKEPYRKSAECGWAGYNIACLKDIKKGLIEVLDVYAN
jgi:hypothetical protein